MYFGVNSLSDICCECFLTIYSLPFTSLLVGFDVRKASILMKSILPIFNFMHVAFCVLRNLFPIPKLRRYSPK